MTTQEIIDLQKQLNAAGYKGKDGRPLTVDGQVGTNTTYALQRLLRDRGYQLTADGIWGSRTQSAYNSYFKGGGTTGGRSYDSSVGKDWPGTVNQGYQSSPSRGGGSGTGSRQALQPSQVQEILTSRAWPSLTEGREKQPVMGSGAAARPQSDYAQQRSRKVYGISCRGW